MSRRIDDRRDAKVLVSARSFTERAAAFVAAIAARTARRRAFIGSAVAAHRAGGSRKAGALWRALRIRFPDGYEADRQRRRALALLEDDQLDEAATIFAELERRCPDKHWGAVGLARIATRRQRWIEAVEGWQGCLSRFPEAAKDEWTRKLEYCQLAADQGLLLPKNEEIAESPAAKRYYEMIRRKKEACAGHGLPLNFGSVLVVTYGRSGSTLLQGVLNSIDGVVVRGENDNILFNLFRVYDTVAAAKQRHKRPIPQNNPWHGIDSPDLDRLTGQLRDVAETIVLSDRVGDESVQCFGFKEIRYDEVGDRLGNYLDFLSMIFPEPAFIFATRNLDDVVKSGWWKDQDPDEVRRSLTEVEERFTTYAHGRSNCFELTYEDLLARTDRLREMFDFLGAPYRPDVLDLVMATPHSYSPSQDRVKQIFEEF